MIETEYTREECEKLVMLADDDGYILFKDIQKAFPGEPSSFFYDWIGDSFKIHKGFMDARDLTQDRIFIMFWVDCPKNYS